MSSIGRSTPGWLRTGAAMLGILVGILVLSACRPLQNSGTSTTGATVNLNGAGATFPFPLYSKWFEVYGQQNPTVRINYQSIGSGGGIKQLQAGTVDFGASDAPLSDEEMKAMPKPVVHLPMVAGAVALAYNLPNVPTGLKLSPEAVAGIFLGEITKWNDPQIASLNPGVNLPNIAVAVAHRSDGSGTTYIFTHYLAAISKSWSTKVGSGKSVNWPVGVGGKGNEGVAGVLTQTPGSIGYVELAYATQNKLSYASIRNQAGQYIAPSIASTTAAAAGAVTAMKKDVRVSIVNATGKEAYPISGFTYILLYKEQPDAAKGTALVNFLRWAIHDGQQYAAPLVYAPLPAEVVTINDQTLAAITHNGQPIQAAK
ncbi:MAG TPA: phosphate ABC transporter substrate-binding protein PstS [Armatimonadota bacterium]